MRGFFFFCWLAFMKIDSLAMWSDVDFPFCPPPWLSLMLMFTISLLLIILSNNLPITESKHWFDSYHTINHCIKQYIVLHVNYPQDAYVIRDLLEIYF